MCVRVCVYNNWIMIEFIKAIKDRLQKLKFLSED